MESDELVAKVFDGHISGVSNDICFSSFFNGCQIRYSKSMVKTLFIIPERFSCYTADT